MPTCTELEKTSLDSTTSKPRTDRNPECRLKSFEIAVFQYKENPSDSNLASLEKILQVLTKVSDLELLASNTSVLIDLKDLLNVNSTSNAALSLILKLVTHVPRVRITFRDGVGLVSTLSQMLSSLSPTNHGKIKKILDVLRFIIHGIVVDRLEAFVDDLVPKLIGYVTSKDTTHLCPALSVLVFLCEKNYLVKKTVLSILSHEDRKNLFTKCFQDQKLTVLHDYLDLILSTANLSSTATKTRLSEKFETRLVVIVDAFSAAYNEDDVMLLAAITDFLMALSTFCSETRTTMIPQLIQQIVVCGDYSGTTTVESNKFLFLFVRSLLRFSSEILSTLDVVTKAVVLRLDPKSIGILHSEQAVLLISDVINRFGNEKTEFTSTTMQNVRLQLDTVIPLVCEVLSNVDVQQVPARDEEVFLTLSAIFDTLISIAASQNWRDLVTTRFCNPQAVLDMLKKFQSRDGQCVGNLIAKLLKFGNYISTASHTWEHFMKDAYRDSTTNSILLDCVRANCHPESTSFIIQSIAKYEDTHDKSQNGISNLTDKSSASSFMELSPQYSFDVLKVSEVLDECTGLLRRGGSVEEVVSMTLQLSDLKITSHIRQLEALKVSLRAADDRIASQNIRALQLENEVSKYSQLTKSLWNKIDSSQKELSDLKKQFYHFQEEASSYKKKVSSDLEAKESEVKKFEEIIEKQTAKLSKFKDHFEQLESTIKEHENIRAELEERIKTETKISHDLTVTLTKREEKLRKKERLLEDEMSEREKLEKEVDRLNKEVSSLQSLTKRQEQALAKKDKQLQENQDELNEMRRIHEQIFNLSKLRSSK